MKTLLYVLMTFALLAGAAAQSQIPLLFDSAYVLCARAQEKVAEPTPQGRGPTEWSTAEARTFLNRGLGTEHKWLADILTSAIVEAVHKTVLEIQYNGDIDSRRRNLDSVVQSCAAKLRRMSAIRDPKDV